MYHERSGGLGLVRASGVGAGVSVRTLWILVFYFTSARIVAFTFMFSSRISW